MRRITNELRKLSLIHLKIDEKIIVTKRRFDILVRGMKQVRWSESELQQSTELASRARANGETGRRRPGFIPGVQILNSIN